MGNDLERLRLFFRFCKENGAYESLFRQTTVKRLIKSLDIGLKSEGKMTPSVAISPLYADNSVGFRTFKDTKEGFEYWWDMHNDFRVWVCENILTKK